MIESMTNITTGFFARRPAVKFLDVTIEHADTAQKIADFLNVDKFPLERTNKGQTEDEIERERGRERE